MRSKGRNVAGRRFFLGLFSADEEVLAYAYTRFFHVLLFQSIASTYEISGSTMRGMGYSLTPALLTVFGTCLFRIIWANMVFHPGQSFGTLLNAYPASWILTGTIVLCAYYRVRKKCLR